MDTKTKNQRLQVQVHLQTTDYQVREEQIRDTTYWVVPVVMMVEGVHHGSRGPLLYTEEELENSVYSWSGMPVTIGHPQDDKGKYISANSPSVLGGIVGRVYNAKMKGDKLTAEVWIEVDALSQVSEEAFEYIKEKKALDVSIGVFSEEVGEEGDFNGELYRAIATNLIPDHLALLPGEEGACSWEDGCGIRNNSKDTMKSNKTAKAIDKAAWLALFLAQGSGNNLTSNEASFGQIMSAVQDKLNALDKDSNYHYLEELYDDYFVYCVVNAATRDRTLYKLKYHLMADGKVEFTGDPVKVRREISFPVVSKLHRTKVSNKQKEVMNANEKCKCTVDSLIKNEATQFTEDDREWLSAMSQEQLEKLAPKEVKAKEPAVHKTEGPKTEKEELVTKGQDGTISINGKSIGQYVKDELAKENDPVKFIDNFMPEGLKSQMKTGLKMYQTRRETQIKEIAANSKFKAEQLKNWSDEDLAALHETVVEKEEGNYSALGAGSIDSDSDASAESEIAAMMSFARPKEVAK